MSIVEPHEPVSIAPPRLSPFTRAARIIVRPAAAWADLAERGQVWPPLLVGMALLVGLMALSFQHTMLPTMLDEWSNAVASGRMEQSAMDQMAAVFTDKPGAMWYVIVPQAAFYLLFTLLTALVVWFGAGFVLGTKFRYSQAMNVVCWAGIVRWPALFLTFALAWQRQTFKGVHLGLGALLPEADSPSKLQVGLSTFLDALGPFEAWWVAVVVIGVAALSGAPRRNVAWVLVALYLAFGAFIAAVKAFFIPGA